jgi:hypothetical protein
MSGGLIKPVPSFDSKKCPDPAKKCLLWQRWHVSRSLAPAAHYLESLVAVQVFLGVAPLIQNQTTQ